MSGRYLLDTNIVIALFADESAVIDRLGEAEEVFVPSIVLGELYYGARKSRRVAENMARIDDFAARNVVLGCDTETARRYGRVGHRPTGASSRPLCYRWRPYNKRMSAAPLGY